MVGAEIGRIEEVVGDSQRRRAEWLVVNEYRFGEGRRFVIPAGQASAADGRVWVPYGREHVRASARIAGARFTPKADRPLREHYLLRERAA